MGVKPDLVGTPTNMVFCDCNKFKMIWAHAVLNATKVVPHVTGWRLAYKKIVGWLIQPIEIEECISLSRKSATPFPARTQFRTVAIDLPQLTHSSPKSVFWCLAYESATGPVKHEPILPLARQQRARKRPHPWLLRNRVRAARRATSTAP